MWHAHTRWGSSNSLIIPISWSILKTQHMTHFCRHTSAHSYILTQIRNHSGLSWYFDAFWTLCASLYTVWVFVCKAVLIFYSFLKKKERNENKPKLLQDVPCDFEHANEWAECFRLAWSTWCAFALIVSPVVAHYYPCECIKHIWCEQRVPFHYRLWK